MEIQMSSSVETQELSRGESLPVSASSLVPERRPSFRWSDLRRAPLHDLPIRDEIIYQWLPLSEGMKVMEIGPGSGFTSFRLSRQVKHLTSVDIGAETIEDLRERLLQAPNLKFICADASSASFSKAVGGEFDVVFGLDFFQFVRDPGLCLNNLSGSLRPGGRLLLQWPNYPLENTRAVTYLKTRQQLDDLLRAAQFQDWGIYALKLRPGAMALFRLFHEWPLGIYRRLRRPSTVEKPQNFDQTWAFRNGRSLESYKIFLHSYWALLLAAMRLGGNCFDRAELPQGPISCNLMVLASR